jgi:hypothetical protein
MTRCSFGKVLRVMVYDWLSQLCDTAMSHCELHQQLDRPLPVFFRRKKKRPSGPLFFIIQDNSDLDVLLSAFCQAEAEQTDAEYAESRRFRNFTGNVSCCQHHLHVQAACFTFGSVDGIDAIKE